MNLFGKRGLFLPLAVIVVILSVGVSTQDVNCNDGETGYTLPCNTDLDPWKKMRTKMDGLTSQIEVNESAERGITLWMRIKYGREKVKSIVETPEKLSKAAKATAEALKQKTEEAAEAATKAAEEVADKAKKATGWLQKGAKILGVLASAAQFVGPIMDIVLLFAPLAKSRELKAIESGFAKMGAKIDSVAHNLENIEGALEWNAIVSQLIEFEGNVDHTTEKYKQLVEEMKAADTAEELPPSVKSHIEDLVEAIRTSGDIGNKLQLVDNLFKGTSGFTNGKTLLEMFVDAVDNDCSKILPMSNKLIAVVKDAQRLQYFYELNQKLIKPDDDKGYPKMVYDMYKSSIIEYSKCTNAAASNAQEEMKVLHGNDEDLTDIIDKMEPKYDLYNWMTMKESDKEEENFALINNFARTLDVELTGLSEDAQEKQRLTLFAIKKSSRTEVEDAVGRVQKVLVRLREADLPRIEAKDRWEGTNQELRDNIVGEVRNLFQRDSVLRSLIDQQRMSVILFKNDTSIDLTGWHFKSNMEILQIINKKQGMGVVEQKKFLGFTLGFAFNFRNDRGDFNCVHGNEMDLSFEASFPYCLCNMGYGGDSCEVSLNDAPTSTLSNSVLKMVEIYKVPGMFDLQDDIKKGTDAIMNQLENDKQQIFSVIRQSRGDVKETENAILSAQTIMLNKLKADNARVLNSISGLKEAMEAAFERSRNDMLYQTQEGQKVVINTISEANKRVTDSIKKLTGKVIENRYFRELKLNIPVYQEKFERAISFGSHFAEQDFSEYLRLHEQNFQACKEAVKKAMVEETDSFVKARMQIAMVSGCTDEYTEEIKSTWTDLMELHLAMNAMEMWDLNFKINNSEDQDEINYLEHEKGELEKKAISDTNTFKQVYSSRSCTGFSLSDLVGGGCGASITYPGQSVPMLCSDPNKSLIVITSGQVISEVICNEDSNWAVNVEMLRCVSKCRDAHEGKFYGVGEKRRLPAAPSGYFFADKNGNTVSESTCLAPKYTPPQDCAERYDHGGEKYRGVIAVTTSGRRCQRWDSQFPNTHRFKYDTPEGYKTRGLIENYCRNPSGASSPWCYNGEGTEPRWEYCTIPTCPDRGQECRDEDDSDGRSYQGHMSMTVSGRQCQRWDSQVPNYHRYSGTSSSSENYCRNPSRASAGLWCYNNEGVVPRYEYCDVPLCTDLIGEDLRSVWSVTKKIDIDECATPDFCGYGGTCTNTQGSFTCTCPAGYVVGDSGKCADGNECHSGGVGYEKCLVQRNLGACENTNGGYRCTCLAGSYSTAGNNECVACNCNSNGVTSAVCDGNTGTCLCNPNVGGADCGSCKTGYATFPYCTQCAAGYYGYPYCVKCSCTDAGVTAQYCNPHTAQCECKANVVGTSCDRCAPHHKDFPSCVPDVKDGTLSAWGPWTDWIDQGTCGPSYTKGYFQKRTRTRTCDDSTKNIHGRSCQGDSHTDTETRLHEVCKPLTGVFITLHTDYHAGTTADLWMGIRQGNYQCRTSKPTWDGPDEEDYRVTYWKYGKRGCVATFDTTKNIDLYLYSDSSNAVYITKMGAKIGTVTKTWYTNGRYKSIEEDENNGWYTTTS